MVDMKNFDIWSYKPSKKHISKESKKRIIEDLEKETGLKYNEVKGEPLKECIPDDVDLEALDEDLNEWEREIEIKEKSNMKRLHEANEKLIKEVDWEGHHIKFFNTFHNTGTKSHDVLTMEMDGTNTYTGETTWINRPWHRFDLEEAFDEIVSKAFGPKALALVREIDKDAHSVEDAIDKFFAQFKSSDIQANDEAKVDDSTEGRKNALAKELGVDPSELEEVDDDTFAYDDGEYKVLTDEEADYEAEEWARSLWEDLGLEGVSDWMKDWILENALDEDELEGVVDEDVRYSIDDMSDDEVVEESLDAGIVEEDDVYDEDGLLRDDVDIDDLREQLVEHRLDEIREDEGFGSYMLNTGFDDEYLSQYIDEDKVIEALVDDMDTNGSGRGEAIASYDGDEIELDGGLYAYRIN